jgi:uncharacterized membrane protein HdeD (DUF308 family)
MGLSTLEIDMTASTMSANVGGRTKTPMGPLADALQRMWWAVILRGMIAVLFGIAVLAWPGLVFTTLLVTFGIFCLADGVLGIWAAFAGGSEHRWLQLVWALVSVGAGLATLLVPGVTALALLFYIGAWAVTTGVLQIVSAIQLRREIEGEWLLMLSGLLSVLFGILLFARPGAGAMAIVTLLGVFAIASGVALILLGWRARTFVHAATSAHRPRRHARA